ncbi:MAG: site-specific integrase [Clostridiales bacterium]|nr:site-specific integrase [Candidatus Crickella merdequi]
MAIKHNEKTKRWEVRVYYKDVYGKRKQKHKVFKKQADAVKWQSEFLLSRDNILDMSFETFVQMYLEYKKSRVKASTYENKLNVINTKILPYFGERPLQDIKSLDVIKWQNHLMGLEYRPGKKYSKDYLRTIHSVLNAIFSHAVKQYGLKVNPAKQAGAMGGQRKKDLEYWTKEEFAAFLDCVANKPISYYGFEVMYWTGLRKGEVLALTPNDIDFKKNTISVNKTMTKVNGKISIGTPKTEKSRRVVPMPEFLANELKLHIRSIYGIKPNDRIFPVGINYFNHEIERGIKASGVKPIDVHGLRHSHASLLVNMGYPLIVVSERLGHESIKETMRYAHMYPSTHIALMDDLTKEREAMLNVSKE